MITTIIILSVGLLISIYVNINQMRKQESQEDYITDLETSNTEYYNFFQSLKTKLGEANSQIKNADRLGAFEAADEVESRDGGRDQRFVLVFATLDASAFLNVCDLFLVLHVKDFHTFGVAIFFL